MTPITYDPAFMDEVSSKYADCATAIAAAIAHLDKVKSSFEQSFEGQSEQITLDTYAKIKEHLELLQMCFIQTGRYVTTAKVTMQFVDRVKAKAIEVVEKVVR